MSILSYIYMFSTFGSLQVALLAVLCVIGTLVLWGRPRNLPPGPRGLPIVGNALSLIKGNRLLLFAEWSKKYGDVFTVHYGPRRTVLLNSYAAIHEALVKNAEIFSSRPVNSSQTVLNPEENILGIIAEPYGPTWKKHRKFALMSLRDFGLGKRSLEGTILEEARALGDEICQQDGGAFCISQMMQNAVSNVICSIVFGCRYEYDDKTFKELLKAMQRVVSAKLVEQLALWYRPVSILPGVRQPCQELKNSLAKLMDHIKERIKEHEETFNPNDIRDFIDAFLLESKQQETDDSPTFAEQQHATIVYQLFLAGTDTTSTTLRWALLYMILHPDIQEKVQQEIDSVLGPNQEPSMAHRSQMPYTEATLAEVLRLAPVVPLSVIHSTSNDTTFRSYNIPKNTSVLVNIWSVHHDPKLWPEPDKFDPTRFLDDAGKYVKRAEVITFSLGRRVCLGEQLARMELFLIFTALLQRFSFKLPEGVTKPSEEGIHGAVYQPVPFMMTAEPRE